MDPPGQMASAGSSSFSKENFGKKSYDIMHFLGQI